MTPANDHDSETRTRLMVLEAQVGDLRNRRDTLQADRDLLYEGVTERRARIDELRREMELLEGQSDELMKERDELITRLDVLEDWITELRAKL